MKQPKLIGRVPNKQSPTPAETKPVIACPFCWSRQVIKKGLRRKKYERVQLYFCQSCKRKFTPLLNKHHSYPLQVILDAITLYNRFYSMQEAAKIVSGSYGLAVRHQTVAKWLKDFKEYLPILRTRSALIAGCDPRKAFIESRLLHGQVYDFKCHYAKLDHLLRQHSPNGVFRNLQSFLKDVHRNCPHDLFRKMAKTVNRSSKHEDVFSLDEVNISPRPASSAIKNARFVLQAVSNNKLRHQRVQDFMLTNDSATVAIEVPITLMQKDLDSFRHQLNFRVPLDWKIPKAITGHIDILQIRSGMLHILDFKPGARSVKPVAQLTIYALALSRLTGIKLYHFKCAWFDDRDYYEFYPLQVVHKLKSNRAKR